MAPSLPGFGFSDQPERLSSPWIDDLWATLMTDVLGYERFGAQGGDIGAGPTTKLARWYPERVIGIHINSDAVAPDPEPPADEQSEEERAYAATIDRWERDEGAYGHIQGTKPQTLAYGLNDSPAGLAAWIVEKFRSWGDTEGAIERRFGRERYERTKQRLGRQHGAKVARVDLAGQLAEAIWHVLTKNEPFHPAGPAIRLVA